MTVLGKRPRSKLWLGFGLACLAVVVWVCTVQWTLGSASRTMSSIPPGATPEQLQTALAAMRTPMTMMTAMMIGYAVSLMIGLGAIIVSAMGLIDYAAEVRARGTGVAAG